MAPRGIPWDDLPKWFDGKAERERRAEQDRLESEGQSTSSWDVSNREVNYKTDAIAVGRRVAFGAVTGVLTGATFGLVDALRDTKNMTGNSKLVRSKVFKYMGLFGG